ncbi:Hypothetical protein, putative [Bodo saltans]|uniref:Uncharacterized protein n=1 Tax=Bodo saltans TaxID=75058 RepID=A0A0S4KG16_BODSA|nr:Hypothetical protein, putative [Bodo saltans]|eukprot:CUI14546.1 Hypothetical protein, putative [Bodo saltans]
MNLSIISFIVCIAHQQKKLRRAQHQMSLTGIMPTSIVVLGSLITMLVSADTWCASPKCASLEMTAEFVMVDYDWTGSGYANSSDAQRAGVFIPSSNLVTGINFYKNTTFLCVPRWRSGVPSTLNTLEFDATSGAPVLKPFPNWDWQRNVLHYVQAVYVDRVRGNIWIIDTGRENFMLLLCR